MNEMGFNKGTAARADMGWIVMKIKNKDVYSDGHILDFSEPPYKTWRNYLGKRNENAEGKREAGRVVPLDAKRQIKPVAFGPHGPIKGPEVVLFDGGQGYFASFDRRFVNGQIMQP